VARVELGARDYTTNSYLDGKPAQGMGVFQRPGSNALATALAVRQTMDDLSKDFPVGLEYRLVYDPTVFVQESMNAVLHTVLEAVVLVFIVVLIFLQDWRAAWELDIFGRVRRSIEASAAVVGAAEASRQEVIVSLLAEVARNYFELRGAQNRLAVARRNVENQRQTLDLTVALLEEGRGTELDTARAQAQLTSTLASIPPLESPVKQTMYRLGVLVGQQPTALEAELAEPLPLPAVPALVALGQPDALLRRRPDIRAAERNLAAATANIGIATADLFPRFTLAGSVALQATSLTGLGTGRQ
jgi:hypothetical protein